MSNEELYDYLSNLIDSGTTKITLVAKSDAETVSEAIGGRNSIPLGYPVDMGKYSDAIIAGKEFDCTISKSIDGQRNIPIIRISFKNGSFYSWCHYSFKLPFAYNKVTNKMMRL